MSCAQAVRDFVADKPLNQLIFSRDLVHLGTRGAVDTAVWRMVIANLLIRVTWGGFLKAGSIIPPTEEIIRKKAEAFGRKIATHGSAAAEELGLPRIQLASDFCISSGSSGFRIALAPHQLPGVCDRKRYLQDTSEGKLIRAFWQLKKETFVSLPFDRIKELEAKVGASLAGQAKWMPYWMSDRFIRGS